MISFRHVTYTYPEATRPVLRDVSFDLPEASFTLVMGASGVGKSTLLRCINGLVPHFSGGALEGSISVDQRDPVRDTPQVMSRHVGFVFQDPEAQFVVDRVEDEIAFALENAALPRDEMRVRVEEALDLLDLAPLRDRRLDTLSGGERQRVAIASALALRPHVLVLDEPTSQLDPQSAEDVLHALVRLNDDLGLTIVLAEHRLERVLPFVDGIVYLTGVDGGRRTDDENVQFLGSHADSSFALRPPSLIIGTPRDVLPQLPLLPPLVALGKTLGWQPLPLTIKEGLRWSRAASREAAPSPPRPQPPREGPPYLRVRGVEVTYGGQTALRGVDLDIWPGEVVALLGRNGSGKTTLLRSVVGLLRPRRGTITVAGRDTTQLSVADVCRQVGYLPQDPNALLFAESVMEELLITLANHGEDGPAAHRRATVLLEQLGLADLASAYPRDLSVGERQRVALGAITVTEPGALLLDEPTRGLDYLAKEALLTLLRHWRSEGTAILLVTHDVELAAAIADRVVVLSQGEVIANGDPASILGTSPLFAPQVARLFPNTGWLTVEDALRGLNAT